LRILTYTTLYPNAAAPHHGVFVENRLRHLVGSGEVAASVVAPVPWFPFQAPVFGEYAVFARAPAAEQRYGLAIAHPRYPLLPRAGMTMAPASLYLFTRAAVRRIQTEGHDFDLIDAHFLYPDGVAAVLLGWLLNKPVVITARGNDRSLVPRYRSGPRFWDQGLEWSRVLIRHCDGGSDGEDKTEV